MKLNRMTILVASALATLAAHAGAATGPSSSQSNYIVGTAPGVNFTSILTTGDAVDGYKMAGIPDGLGVIDNGSYFTVFMNHELTSSVGVPRLHGGKGAFVSAWEVDKATLKVNTGYDAIRTVKLWDAGTSSYVTGSNVTFSRFCSADLPAVTAFYNPSSGLGTTTRFFLNGEETDATGRAFATTLSGARFGTTYELNKFGGAAWENVVASPYAQNKTIVAQQSDGAGNRVYMYVGNKQSTGTDLDRAGLTNGTNYVVNVAAAPGNADNRSAPLSGSFTLDSNLANGTSFLRPEDGAWDTKNPNKYYFVTTDRPDAAADGNVNSDIPSGQIGRSRLYSLTFTDITDPTAGGKIEALLDGTEGQQMFDNITVDVDGNLILQEDVGNNKHLGKVWKYVPGSDSLTEIGAHDVNRFGDLTTLPTAPFTKDEESSGVIDVTDLFNGVAGYDTVNKRYYLLDVQAHYPLGGELVEGGQLLLMSAPVPEPETYAMMGAGLGLMSLLRARRRRAIR